MAKEDYKGYFQQSFKKTSPTLQRDIKRIKSTLDKLVQSGKIPSYAMFQSETPTTIELFVLPTKGEEGLSAEGASSLKNLGFSSGDQFALSAAATASLRKSSPLEGVLQRIQEAQAVKTEESLVNTD